MRPIIITLSMLLMCAAASATEVYKWKDKDGRVHYGDRPKAGDAQQVIVTPPSDEPSPILAETTAREAECQQKKGQLESWRKAPTMSEVDNLGKTREYTAAERQQFLDMTQVKVDALCAPRAPSPEAAGTFPPPEEKYIPVEVPPEEPAPESQQP